MHKISLAPVLSATLSRDSCWIISALSSQTCQRMAAIAATGADKSVSLLGLLEDFDEAPALGSAQRPGLHNAYPITNGGTVLLVVCLEPAGLAQHLAVQAVLHPVLDRNHNGL